MLSFTVKVILATAWALQAFFAYVPYLESVGFIHAAEDVGAGEDAEQSALHAPQAGTTRSSSSIIDPLEQAHPETVPEDSSGIAEGFEGLAID
jgi:hypothetical protein